MNGRRNRDRWGACDVREAWKEQRRAEARRISNPLSVIEQITLLFIKRLDELYTREEHKATRTGHPAAVVGCGHAMA